MSARYSQFVALAGALGMLVVARQAPEPQATIEICTALMVCAISLVLNEMARWRRL